MHKAFHALQLTPIQNMLQLLDDFSNSSMQPDANRSPSSRASVLPGPKEIEEARAALYYVDPQQSSPNPFVSAFSLAARNEATFTPELCRLAPPFEAPIPPPPPPPSRDTVRSSPDSQEHEGAVHGPCRPKKPRETGVVLVENLPFAVVEGEALQKAMERFGEVKFVFVPRDKVDSTKGTGKA